MVLNNLADVYCQTGRLREADELFRQTFEIQRSSLGPAHPHVRITLRNHAAVLRKMGERRRASELEKQAAAIGAARPDMVDIQTLRADADRGR